MRCGRLGFRTSHSRKAGKATHRLGFRARESRAQLGLNQKASRV